MFDGTNICLPTVHLYINCLWCSFLSCATVNCDVELCWYFMVSLTSVNLSSPTSSPEPQYRPCHQQQFRQNGQWTSLQILTRPEWNRQPARDRRNRTYVYVCVYLFVRINTYEAVKFVFVFVFAFACLCLCVWTCDYTINQWDKIRTVAVEGKLLINW